jgi:trehalose 6-phosphate phosphatase
MTSAALARHVARRRRGRGLVAIFDLDGTLAPITPKPDAARVPIATRSALAHLCRRSDTTVGVVSGRRLAEVVRMLSGVERKLFLAGIHGYEARTPGGRVGRRWTPAEEGAGTRLQRALDAALQRFPRVRTERKGPVVAVHTRGASPGERRLVRATVRRLLPAGHRLLAGRRVLELRPVRGPTKADAVRWIATARPGAALLYVGDDRTDEDAFRALGSGDVAVLVGGARTSAEQEGRPAMARRRSTTGTLRVGLSGPAAVGRLVARLAAS